MEKEPALPKNIRQIGEISGKEKVCVEDYVMTWIHKREKQEDKGYLGIFFGERQEAEDSVYVFIRGVFEVPAEIQEPQQQEAVRQEYEKYFGDWTVQGCCVIGVYPTERMRALGEWIPESGKLIYHLQDQEETLYWTGEEQYRRLQGYFVFYEQNKKMQEYLAELFKENSVEKESAPDRAIRSFREKVKEKGEQRQSSFLRMASSFFVIAILIIGAIVVNRVEDIRTARNLSATDGSLVYQAQEEGENGRDVDASAESTAVWKAAGMAEIQDSTQASGGSGNAAGTDVQSGAESAAGTDIQSGAESAAGTDIQNDTESPDSTGTQGSGGTESPDGEEAMSKATVQADAESGGGGVQDPAAMDAAQYNAIQQAAEEAALPGPDTFWEESDLEAAAENTVIDPSQAAAENSVSDPTQAAAESNVTDPTQAAAENSVSDPTQAAAENTMSGTDDLQDAQEAVAVRHTQAGYVIREGDTLAKICSRYYGSIDRIAEVCEANGIEDANVILPGQRIVLP